MKTFWLTLAFLVLLAVSSFAQNPCTAALPSVTLVSTSSSVLATIPDFNATAISGGALVTEIDLAVFTAGANPVSSVPISSATVQKAGFTLRAGTTDCYQHTPPTLFGVTENTVFDLHLRKRGPGGVTAWSMAVPFGRVGAPAATTDVRIIP